MRLPLTALCKCGGEMGILLLQEHLSTVPLVFVT